jgi:hypothetical protein
MRRRKNVSDEIAIHLDSETLAHYQGRANQAGRTLEEQLIYELSVNHGLAAPDIGDHEALERARVWRVK